MATHTRTPDGPKTSDLSRIAKLLSEEAATVDYYSKQWGDIPLADLDLPVLARLLRSQASVELAAQILYEGLWELLIDSGPHSIEDEGKRLGAVAAAIVGREPIEDEIRAKVSRAGSAGG